MRTDLLIRDAIGQLKESGIEEARFEAELLLSSLTGKDRSWFSAHPEEVLPQLIQLAFQEKLHRRMQGEPLQYITGMAPFMGLLFHVTPAVLIPRPDTEILVEQAMHALGIPISLPLRPPLFPSLSEIKRKQQLDDDSPLLVADIGTGSGCIPISLAYEAKQAGIALQIYAFDLSEEALSIARKNAETHGVSSMIRFHRYDVFSGDLPDGPFDMILSNPPYIPESEISGLMREVKEHEPMLALDGGADGLRFYREIAQKSRKCLKKEGLVFVEVGIGQAEDVCQIFSKNSFETFTAKDLAEIERVVGASDATRRYGNLHEKPQESL